MKQFEINLNDDEINYLILALRNEQKRLNKYLIKNDDTYEIDYYKKINIDLIKKLYEYSIYYYID